MNNSVGASGLKIIITIRIIMFILLFIVLRHQYLCSAVWTVCSYTSNAWSTTSNIRVAECLSLRVCKLCARAHVCVLDAEGGAWIYERDSEAVRICSPFSRTQRRMQMPFTFGFMSATLIGVNSPEGHGYSPGATQPWKPRLFSFPAEVSGPIILGLADQ